MGVQAGEAVGSAQATANQKTQDAKQYAADTAEYAKLKAAETAEAARKSTKGTKHAANKAYNQVCCSAHLGREFPSRTCCCQSGSQCLRIHVGQGRDRGASIDDVFQSVCFHCRC